ncbi:MAG TPA: ABC transporter permease [Bacteroidales bacterium]|nr:ABC transporter permease [Bacteroidales bacterium]
MNTELYLAKRILPHKDTANISKPIVNIAIIAIALGLAVMIVSVSVIIGFKSTISDKIFGFSSHIQIVNFDTNTSYESVPISKDSILVKSIKTIPDVVHVQTFATKPGIIKVNNAVKGVIVKGIDNSFNTSFFQNHKIDGSMVTFPDTITDRVLVSKQIADLLQLHTGESFIITFVPNESSKKPRKRRFVISGIYQTNLQEIDSRFILADIRHIQALNNWENNQISGYEVFLDSHKKLQKNKQLIQDEVGYDIGPDVQRLKVQTLQEVMPQIFDWLALLDMNAWVIIILMVLVAGMNMITGLLVIILEKTMNIGILKTLGIENVRIQKIFLYIGAMLIGKGMLWGNIIGISLCVIQMYFKVIPLDPATYFMSYIPIYISVPAILALNVGTLILTVGMLLLPSFIISKISPAQAIRFE